MPDRSLIASSPRLAVVPTSPVQGQPQADEPEALPQALRADALGLSDAARAAHADPATSPAGDDGAISERGLAQMKKLVEVARRAVGGKRPGGYCYRAVHLYLMRAGYGHLRPDSIPWTHTRYARQFGEYLNQGDHAARLGLRKLPIDNPYDAPPGSVVVVRPGTPGTRHPKAGDIAIAAGNGKFYNDGNMSYGGPENFPPGNRHVVGIYAPL
ncbi:MAG: hypothetical protein VKP57_08740 [Candidatus Sericytochromatia bacterium]|nr:hypothetical protein [Candidatus Sericytochromatia bacterium]